MVGRSFASLAALLVLLGPSRGHADDDASARHVFELAVGGGLSWSSPNPERLDLSLGGQLSGRAMLELDVLRLEGNAVIPDASRPDLAQLRGAGRLLFVTVHDVTWRRSSANELLRIMAGFGGEVGLPEDSGALVLGIGFAMVHLDPADGSGQPRSELYGAYAGLALRLRLWEIRDELRIAAHAMMPPPDVLAVAGGADVFAGLVGGVTVSNRLYLQALREGPISAGPELFVQVEQLPTGPVVLATLGLTVTLGL